MTGQDILQAEFEKAGMRGGYKADQVDEFLSNIAKFVDNQENEKNDLEYKITILAEKIEQYKKEEDKMKEALIGAQTHGKRVVEEAKVKAEEMIKQTGQACEKSMSEARKKADLLTESTLNKAKTEQAEIQRDCLKERELLEKLKAETSKFRKSLLEQYKIHIAAIQNLPDLVDKSFEARQTQPQNQTQTPRVENKAKQIMREEETKVVKEKPPEPRAKVERNNEPKPKSKHVQVQKDRLLEEEESKLEKSRTLDFDSENINIHTLTQATQQPIQSQQQAPTQPAKKPNKPKHENEPTKNRHVQNERPDYVKKWGDLDFGKNQSN